MAVASRSGHGAVLLVASPQVYGRDAARPGDGSTPERQGREVAARSTSRSSASAISSQAARRLGLPLARRGRSPRPREARAIASYAAGDVPVRALPLASSISTQRRACHSAGSAATEHRVDPRAQPLAAGEVDRLADLAPVVARRVGAVDHLVGLGRRAVGLLEERPGVVVEVDARARRLGGRVELASDGGRGVAHDRSLSFTHWPHDVEDALEADRPGLDPAAVGSPASRRRSAGSSVASSSRISSSGISRSRRRAIVRAVSSCARR